MAQHHTTTIHEVAPRFGDRQFVPVCSTHPHWKPMPCISRGTAQSWIDRHKIAAEMPGTPWTYPDGFNLVAEGGEQ